MNCPHCHSSSIAEQEELTVHGFRRFRCRECGRRYNERTGTALNRVRPNRHHVPHGRLSGRHIIGP